MTPQTEILPHQTQWLTASRYSRRLSSVDQFLNKRQGGQGKPRTLIEFATIEFTTIEFTAIEFTGLEFAAAEILVMTKPDDTKDYRARVSRRCQLIILAGACMSPR